MRRHQTCQRDAALAESGEGINVKKDLEKVKTRSVLYVILEWDLEMVWKVQDLRQVPSYP